MNHPDTAPILKTPEPFTAEPLRDKWVQAGLIEKDAVLDWLGSGPYLQRYRLDIEKSEAFLVPILCEEEKIIFCAFQDWFQGAVKKAAEAVCGYFTLDVLQFGVGDEPWSWQDFTALLIAHAKKLKLEERGLIQFGSFWGVLHKRTEADWGRIESRLSVEFYKPSTAACLRLIKKQIAQAPAALQTVRIFRDLSRQPVDAENEDDFLMELKHLKESSQTARLVYWHAGSGKRLQV